MLDQLTAAAPLINTALLLVLVLGGPLVWLQLRKATPLAIRAEVDRVTMSMGELRRAQKELEREQGQLRHERMQQDGEITELHARITDLSGSIAGSLDAIKKGLSLLACSEENWHRGEKPGFCPLHQRSCPFNGALEAVGPKETGDA